MENKKKQPNNIYVYALIGVILILAVIIIIISLNKKTNNNDKENTDYINTEIVADKIIDIDDAEDLKDLKYYLRDNNLYFRNISKNEKEALYAENVKDIRYSNGYVNVILYENGNIIKESSLIRYEYEDGFSNKLINIEEYALQYFKKYDKEESYEKDYEFVAKAELDLDDENVVYVEISHTDGETKLLDVKYTVDYTFLKGTSSLGKDVDFNEFK
jgi:hypothetical protein